MLVSVLLVQGNFSVMVSLCLGIMRRESFAVPLPIDLGSAVAEFEEIVVGSVHVVFITMAVMGTSVQFFEPPDDMVVVISISSMRVVVLWMSGTNVHLLEILVS